MTTKQISRALLMCLLLTAPGLGGQEQLEQETISIRGNQGLPKTLYIAPWKRVGSPLQGETPEGTFSEEIEPLEPELFQRELELHREGYSVD